MAGEAAPLTRNLEAQSDAVAAGATGSESIRDSIPGTVTKVSYIPVAALAGANTNSRTLTLLNRGQDGAGATVVATLALTAGVNLVAFQPKDIPVSGTAANLVVAEGDILEWRSTFVGTGIADPGGSVYVSVSRVSGS